MEALSQVAQAIGRIGHPVQQQYSHLGGVHTKLEAAVPIRRPTVRVGKTAAVIAVDPLALPGGIQAKGAAEGRDRDVGDRVLELHRGKRLALPLDDRFGSGGERGLGDLFQPGFRIVVGL